MIMMQITLMALVMCDCLGFDNFGVYVCLCVCVCARNSNTFFFNIKCLVFSNSVNVLTFIMLVYSLQSALKIL